MRRALAALGPPADELLLGRDLTRGLRLLDASLKRGKTSPREVEPFLKRLAASEWPFPAHTHGGGFPLHISTLEPASFVTQLANTLYLPVEAEPAWIPPDHRYVHEQSWSGGAGGFSSAWKDNGTIYASQLAKIDERQASSFAGVYILVKTGAALEGPVTQITFNPEIDWLEREHFHADFIWAMPLYGTVRFSNRIWVVVYERNPVTGQFEPLVGGSAVAHEVFSGSWFITSSGDRTRAGSFRDGAAALRFVASPSRTYLMGVVTQMSVSHDLINKDRWKPIPPPAFGEFEAYGQSAVHVPAMWVTHQVLSP